MMMECESRKSAGWAMQVAATRHDTTLVGCVFRFFVQTGIYSSLYACIQYISRWEWWRDGQSWQDTRSLVSLLAPRRRVAYL
jgi:hypothetical protein